MIEIPCLVDSNPEPTRFKWQFQSRGADASGNHRIVDLPSSQFSSDHDQSILNYQADKEDLSGFVYCRAENPVGEQRRACKFQVVKESRPDLLKHCTAVNVTWEVKKIEYSGISI